MDHSSQGKTLEMQRGLFLIKYESSESFSHPPRVRVHPDPGSEDSIELILPPDADEAILWSPGASLVARASRNGRLRVVVTAAEPNGSVAARVQVIVLSNDPGGARERESTARLDLRGFRVLGHVAGRGDVVVDADNWIAGPSAPSRIEGICIQWPDKPRDIRLSYAVTAGGPRPVLGPLVQAGDFAGTRGRALPLVGATLEISGAAANGQQLVVDSIFLGSPQMSAAGQRVVLAGPTGREPLVGLRVRIEPVGQSAWGRSNAAMPQLRRDAGLKQDVNILRDGPGSQASRASVAALEGKFEGGGTATSPVGKRSGRVRVFRSNSRNKIPQAAG
jgi:hypothetical protein